MAKKVTTNKTTTNKGQARKRNTKKKKKNTNLMIVIGIGIACIGMVIITSIINNKSKETAGEGTPVVTETPSEELTPEVTITVSPTGEATITPEPTQPVEPSVTETPKISEAEALKLVQDAIADKQYSIVLKNENLSIDGKEYFEYQVSLDNKELQPAILVMKESGDLYYYDQAGMISSFSKFPLDKVESAGSGESVITEKEAIDRIAKLGRAALGLERELNQYTIEVDEWTTVVNGENSYGINVFDEISGAKQLAGVYYVSVDGSNVYMTDEDTQDFIKISE